MRISGREYALALSCLWERAVLYIQASIRNMITNAQYRLFLHYRLQSHRGWDWWTADWSQIAGNDKTSIEDSGEITWTILLHYRRTSNHTKGLTFRCKLLSEKKLKLMCEVYHLIILMTLFQWEKRNYPHYCRNHNLRERRSRRTRGRTKSKTKSWYRASAIGPSSTKLDLLLADHKLCICHELETPYLVLNFPSIIN